MNNKEDGGQAFPLAANEYAGHGPQAGMSLRDYFAAKAMDSMIARYGYARGHVDQLAQNAFDCADAMLAERAK